MKKSLTILILLHLAFGIMFAQDAQVTGKVSEENGDPVVGAAVFYEGTSTATMTDVNGSFSIKFLKGKSLVISCFGLKDEKITINDTTPLNVVLMTEGLTLEDAVVIGYGSVTRKDLTGSVSSVKADEIVRSGSSNALGALQGHVAGLSITSQSGEPGAGYSIKIRGNNSINAGTTPLFVIDGMQMDVSSGEIATSSATGTGGFDPLSFINPNDIESIDVLKDASATAIYGARGANGVVIITTKGGASGYDKTLINFDASFGVAENPKYIEMLGTQEYINYRFGRKDYGYFAFGVDTDGDGIVDSPEPADTYEYYDWQKIMYRKAISQNYNLSLSSMIGGKTQIAASIGYLNQQGLIVNNDQQRYTGRIKLDHSFKKKLKVGATVNFGRTISSGAVSSGGGSLGYSGLVQYIYLERPIKKWYADEADEYANIPFGLLSLITDETFKKTTYDRLTGNAYFNWEIIKDLNFRIDASGGTSNSTLLEYYSSKSKWGRSKNGKATNSKVETYNYNVSAQLNYKHSWNETHNLEAMVAGEMTYYNTSNVTISGSDFADESLGAYNIGRAGIIEAPDQSVSDNAKMSFISRASYNYKQRYYLTATFRADGSSKFFPGNRVGYFPSISAAWRINEEPWMKAVWLDNLKIRFSAGASGNDRISNYAALATLGQNYYAMGGVEIMGIAPTASANPNLKWETTYQYDAGIDFSAFGEKLNITADVYYKDTRDMLYQATLSAQAGYTTQWQNLGRVENKGLEIAVNTHNIDTHDFSWSTNLTFDLSRNKVLDIGGVDYTMVQIGNGVLSSDISRIMVGQPIGIGWGYLCDGNYQLDDFIITDKNTGRQYPSEAVTSLNYGKFNYTLKDDVVSIAGKSVQPGDRKYKNLNPDEDNEITPDDRTKISDSNPLFTCGFGNTFRYKGFDLNIFLEGVYGRQILNEFKLRSESGESGGTQNNNLTKAAWYGHWTPENGSQTYSRLLNNTNTYCSDYYVEDGSFLRIKTLALGYNLPAKALSKIRIQSLRVSFTVDNVFCFTKYSGNDPDVSSSNVLFPGFDRMSYPKARTYSFGINIGF